MYKLVGGTSSSTQVCQYFSTQSFTHWLESFLARPGIEDMLAESLTPAETSGIRDIWYSNMWKTLKTSKGKQFTSSPGNLVSSLNVD